MRKQLITVIALIICLYFGSKKGLVRLDEAH